MREVYVSVIIPVYNGCEYLRETINSVLKQKFQRSIEIIVIDDASSHKSESIVRSLSSDIIYMENLVNSGVAVSRNTAAKQAKGRYVAFLDQDDIWNEDFLSTMTAFLETHPDVGFAFCNGLTIDAESKVTGVMYKNTPGTKLEDFVLSSPIATPSQVLIRHDAFLATNGFVASPVGRGADDWGLWLTMLSKNLRCEFLSRELVLYRIHPRAAHHDYSSMRSNEKWLLERYAPQLGIPRRWIKWGAAIKKLRYKGESPEFQPSSLDIISAVLIRAGRALIRRL